jgi:protein-L-isoaspartate(D-aspartate) O-methyltransferase
MITFIDIFGTSKPRSAESRRTLIESRKPGTQETNDFLNYGFDYFDNETYGVGYGGYKYDGRYKDSVSKMIELFNIQPQMKVLEVGCAKGFILYEFFKQGAEVYGIDLSEYAVSNSIPKIKKNITCGSCCELLFEDDYFDFVYSKEMFPHLNEDEIELAINSLNRVVKRNNIFLEIQVATDDESSELIRKWDSTHQTVKTETWWLNKLQQLGFNGFINFKPLF